MSGTTTPKHLAVYSRLRDEIKNGKYLPGQRMPTETELVDRFGVSRPTISRALGILEQEGHLIRRRGSGTFLKSSEAQMSELFGLLIPRLHYAGIGSPISAGISNRAESLGYGLLLANSLEGGDEESSRWGERFCEQFIKHNVRGVFFVPLELPEGQLDINREIADRLVAAGIAVVLVDRDFCRFPERSEFDLVAIDNYRAGYHVAEHMIVMGCSRLAFVADHPNTSSARERIEGCRGALEAAGLQLTNSFILHWSPSVDAKELLTAARDAKVEAFLFVNDLLAREAISVFGQNGIRVPNDVRIAAFDDLAFAECMSVPLTTVHQPFEALGINAVEAMTSRLLNPDQPPRDIRLAGELIIRDSCGAKLARQKKSK